VFLAIGNSTNYEHEAFGLVRDALRRLGSDAVLFCQDKCLDGAYLTFEKRGEPRYLVTVGDQRHDVDDFDGIWYIKPQLPQALREHENHEYRMFIERQFRAMRKSLLLAFRGKRWLNEPLAMEDAENKPWQLTVASRVGLAVPDTLVTSDPGAAKDFVERCGGDAVIKLLATSPLPNRVVFTSRLGKDSLPQLDRLRYAPAVLQRMVPKDYELRVTVVGDRVFAARIDSQADPETALDWRRMPRGNDFRVSITPTEIPESVSGQLKQFLSALGLRYGAIDLIVTPDGRYVFLEVNPNGQWCFVQQRTGFDIASAIAELLLA
jgi:glutathione synthase/RimK-type ligase-like ATP-grasp enzyme